MLKAIQILGSSSSSSSSPSSSAAASAAGFVSFRFKKKPPHHTNFVALSFISTNSRKQPAAIVAASATIAAQSSSSPIKADFFKLNYQRGPLFCCRCRGFRMPLTHSDSNPTENSSSSASPSMGVKSAGSTRKISFCQSCGGPTKHEIPDGEEKTRAICTLCGKIAYENPKMVVGCLIEHENKILLCKRKIQPSYGLWTLPAGYMEMDESAADGAIRETREEANAEVEVLSPFAHLDIPLIGQTYIIFLAKLKRPHFSPGAESSECRLFSLDDIPFDSLAFSSMLVTLKLYIEDRKTGRPKFHYGVINKRPGTSPSEIHEHTLDHHLHF